MLSVPGSRATSQEQSVKSKKVHKKKKKVGVPSSVPDSASDTGVSAPQRKGRRSKYRDDRGGTSTGMDASQVMDLISNALIDYARQEDV